MFNAAIEKYNVAFLDKLVKNKYSTDVIEFLSMYNFRYIFKNYSYLKL